MSNDPSGKRLADQNGNQAMGWYGQVDAYAVFKVPGRKKKFFDLLLCTCLAFEIRKSG
jgi:hypothetical protein